jgi:hypothetical protein
MSTRPRPDLATSASKRQRIENGGYTAVDHSSAATAPTLAELCRPNPMDMRRLDANRDGGSRFRHREDAVVAGDKSAKDYDAMKQLLIDASGLCC